MLKSQLEARIVELTRICDKETERADKAEAALRELQAKYPAPPKLQTLDEMEAENPNVFRNPGTY